MPNATLHVVGDVSVTGTIYATEYQILNITSIEEEGSTKFGTSADDDHQFTGSVKINGTLTTDGNVTLGDASADVVTSNAKITASAGILIPDSDGASSPTATGIGLHVGTGGDLNLYHDGTNSYIFNQTGDLKIESTVNSAESILIHANGGAAESIMVHADQGTTAKSIELKTDAGGILFNLDATSGKKLHADVESTDADAIHIDSEGGIKLESDAHPVNITGDLTVSGSSIIGTANTDILSLVSRCTASGGILILDADDQAQSLQIGAAGDFFIAHDGTDTAISNATGKLKITSTVDSVDAIRLRANGGTSETIFIRADQGTSVMTDGNSDASIQLKSDAGGIGIRSTANLAGSIQIEADGGTSETIVVKADQGTSVTEGAASVQLLSDVGGIGIKSGANVAHAIRITADAGTSETITIHSDQGTSAAEGAASIQLLSDAGGINIKSSRDGANAILLTADGGTSETIKVHADQGTAGNSIWLKSDAGGIKLEAGTTITGSAAGINLTSTQNDVDCIYIRANGGASEVLKIHSDQGTSVTEGASSVQLLSDAGGVELKSTANLAKSIKLIADGGTSETIYIQADQGTGADSIHLLSDAGGITLAAGTVLSGSAAGINLTSIQNDVDCIYIRANGGTSEVLKIHSDQGTSVTEGAESIAIVSDAGGVGIRSTANLANCVNITADGGTTSTIQIFNDQGTSVTEGASSIQLLSDAGGVELKSTANLAKSIKLIADGGTSETIYIQSDQGTAADSIHLLSDAGGITLQVGSGKLVTVNGGSLVPSADNTLDLGGASNRWRNIYTGDLHLKNDRGDWTIVEESDYLSLRNNGTGKLYKFVLEEVDEE